MTQRPKIFSWAGRPRSGSAQLWALSAATAFLFSLTACEEGATDTEPAPPQVASVSITPDTQDIFTIGATAQFTAEARSENGRTIRDAEFSWSSSDVQVATVSSDGVVTGVAPGSAMITATSGGVSGNASVWVDPARTLRNHCARCHAGRHERTFAMVSCPACHGMIWEDPVLHWGISGGHPTASGGFDLVGAHALANCASCHDLSTGEPWFTATDQFDCIACHDRDYQRQHAGSGFPTACLTCHTTIIWGGASFDHESASGGFALVGAHLQLVCSSCHDPLTGTPLYVPADQNDCIACHDDDYQRQHSGSGFPTVCLTCHTVDAWSGASFDHDVQFFPIFSGEHQDRWSGCATCHTDPNDFAAFTCFNCHEHQEDRMNDKHSDVTGYAYESALCITCHPEGEAP